LQIAWVLRFRDRRMRKISSPGDALDQETDVDPDPDLEIEEEKEEDLEREVEKGKDLEIEDLVHEETEDPDLKRGREKGDLKRQIRNRMEIVNQRESLQRVLWRKRLRLRKKKMAMVIMKRRLKQMENILQLK